MFSTEMSEAVKAVQKTLDMCCKTGNISFVAMNDLANLNALIAEIDPSKINFANRGIFNRSRIDKYWDTFTEKYPELTKLDEKLKKDFIVCLNTVKTLKSVRDKHIDVYNAFREKAAFEDVEYAQQLAVTENIFTTLSSTISEYETLANKINVITTVLMQAINNAVIFAKNTCRKAVSIQISAYGGYSNQSEFKTAFASIANALR